MSSDSEYCPIEVIYNFKDEEIGIEWRLSETVVIARSGKAKDHTSNIHKNPKKSAKAMKATLA